MIKTTKCRIGFSALCGLLTIYGLLMILLQINYSLYNFSARSTQCKFTTALPTTADHASILKDRAPVKELEKCIEHNICQRPGSSPLVYQYQRTDFYQRVAEPVNHNASISHVFPVVPRKVHFCFFSDGNQTFKFHYMVAIIAAARFVKPDTIYFWHDNQPRGEFWEETRRRISNLYLVHRERPTSIRGNEVKVIEHVADVVRLEALLEYGGMYFDLDAIVVNPIDPLLYYDVTMGMALPDTLCNGILFSKPWSDFFKIWHKEYNTFDDNVWAEHSCWKPFNLSRLYPTLIHVESTALCRPHFRERAYLFGDKLWDYTRNNYVVHLSMRYDHHGVINNIKASNTTVGSILRYIYFSNSSLK